ncbi:MAG: FAD-dependent oxidoreductase [Verrucomicrobiae bacterium]|nr:FAD-dependent oxidoreductase [Verrucomicrobiae bacterium]
MKTLAETDVLIVGGGPAGIGAALMAARGGARTTLVERYGRLGGAAINAMVSPFMGTSRSSILKEILDHLGNSQVDFATYDMKFAELLLKDNVEILLHTWAYKAVMKGKTVAGVHTVSKEGEAIIKAKVIIDASADGDIAFTAGAPFEMGRKGNGLAQPMSIMFRIAGVDKSRAMLCGSEECAKQRRVPEGTWEEVVLKGQATGELPKNIGVIRVYESPMPGCRTVNATQVNYVDGTKVADLTKAELEGRRQAFQVVAFLRKHAPGYEKACAAEMPATIGVRETRRFLGLEYLTKKDLVAGRKWDTAVVWDAFFCMDIHNPDGGGQTHGIAERVKPYDIPYGCLVPQKVDNLLVAGRCISGSHEAHASYRVMNIAISTGAAAGAAAALSALNNIKPRHLEVAEIQKQLMRSPSQFQRGSASSPSSLNLHGSKRQINKDSPRKKRCPSS